MTHGCSDDAMDDTTVDGNNDDNDRMTTKRRRMQQLIQKSMDMAPRTFEHETPMLAATATQQLHQIASNESRTTHMHTHFTPAVDAASHRRGKRSSSRKPHTDATVVRSKHSSWTQDEDAKLCALVREHGTSQWSVVAAHFGTRDRKRCRERFVNHLDPQLTQQQRAWTAHEEQQLRALQRELGNRWAAIARVMRGRGPEDVKNRFSALAARDAATEATPAPRAAPSRWSSVEAETLRALVVAHGASNWFFIASQLPGRTDLQCMQQWQQVLDPAIVKGKGTWTAAEDATLAQRVRELGPKWTQIARLLPGRMGKQCRERYLNHLDPSISKHPWTPEEDAALEAACRHHATQWTRIAAELPGRTENALKNRWRALVRLRHDRQDTPTSTAVQVPQPQASPAATTRPL